MSDKAVCVLAFSDNKDIDDIANNVDIINNSNDMIDQDASLWIWARARYENGSLSGDGWQIAYPLKHNYGWKIRNEIIFQCKVADPAPENRLKRGYERILHLVRTPNYYYDRTMGNNIKDNILHNKSGETVTRSGLTGTKYLSQITNSQFLTKDEKVSAIAAWDDAFKKLNDGEISDFRMILRGIHKTTKTISDKVDKFGFYIRTTKYHSLPMEDVWTSFSASNNWAVPEGVLLSILRLSCPIDGIVLDLLPSKSVAKTVIAAGRTYIAKGLEEYIVTEQESSVFDIEGKKCEKKYIESGNYENERSI